MKSTLTPATAAPARRRKATCTCPACNTNCYGHTGVWYCLATKDYTAYYQGDTVSAHDSKELAVEALGVFTRNAIAQGNRVAAIEVAAIEVAAAAADLAHDVAQAATDADVVAALVSGYCGHCGRDNRGYEDGPCSDDCPSVELGVDWRSPRAVNPDVLDESRYCYCTESAEYGAVCGYCASAPQASTGVDVLAALDAEIRAVTIHPIWDILKTVKVCVSWICPVCGGPRGEPFQTLSYVGSRRCDVDGWVNPCGHIDNYADVALEAQKKIDLDTHRLNQAMPTMPAYIYYSAAQRGLVWLGATTAYGSYTDAANARDGR